MLDLNCLFLTQNNLDMCETTFQFNTKTPELLRVVVRHNKYKKLWSVTILLGEVV